jgi:hypothetical protein
MNWKTTGAALALIAAPFAASAQSVAPPVTPPAQVASSWIVDEDAPMATKKDLKP